MAKIFIVEQDENDSYIMTDNFSVVYGYGDTVLEAYKDYIVSLIEYCYLVTNYG